MRPSWPSRRGRTTALRIGVGPDRLVAILPNGEMSFLPLTSPLDLPEALASLSAQVEPGATRLEWCLLPPLVDVRRIEVPRLRAEETTALLTRHARRYFPVVRDEQAVGWRRIGKRSAVPAALMASAAPESLIEAVEAAAAAAGMAAAAPVPAHSAWLSAACTAHPGLRDGAVAVAGEDRTYLLAVRHGLVMDTAVLPAGSSDACERLAAVADGGDVVVLGSGPDLERLDSSEGVPDAREPADVLAAHCSGSAEADLALTTASRRQRRKRAERSAAARRWALASALVVLAAFVEWWGLRRDLNAVQAARQDIAAQVSKAMAERQALETSAGAVATLDSLQATATDWSALLVALTRHLPNGAHLVALRTDSDSVAIEGVALDASKAFMGLRDVPGFTGVVARGPIQREVGAAGPIERFTVGAQLDRGAAPSVRSGAGGSHDATAARDVSVSGGAP